MDESGGYYFNMRTAFITAIELILSGSEELLNILATTAKMSFSSSIIALLIGVPIGILYGAYRFPGRNTLIIINRTLTGIPPVVCGLLFYILFSGVGIFGPLQLLFTVELMIIAQVVLITPLVINSMETFVNGIADPLKESARGLGLSKGKTFGLIVKECNYQIFSAYLIAFARSIAEVGAVSMVGGAIAWKTNVMTTAIMQYTNRGNFSLGLALGIILFALSLLINIAITIMQRRMSR